MCTVFPSSVVIQPCIHLYIVRYDYPLNLDFLPLSFSISSRSQQASSSLTSILICNETLIVKKTSADTPTARKSAQCRTRKSSLPLNTPRLAPIPQTTIRNHIPPLVGRHPKIPRFFSSARYTNTNTSNTLLPPAIHPSSPRLAFGIAQEHGLSN